MSSSTCPDRAPRLCPWKCAAVSPTTPSCWPRPRGLVVTNGSNKVVFTFASTPAPASVTAAQAPSLPAPVVNPMVAMQRRAFGYAGPGSTIQLVVAVAGPTVTILLCSGRVVGVVEVAAVLIPTPALLAIFALRGRSTWPAQALLGGGGQLLARADKLRADGIAFVGAMLGLDDHVVVADERLAESLLAIAIAFSGVDEVDARVDDGVKGWYELRPVLSAASGAESEF